MLNVIINWGMLMKQDKCLAINVPFTDEQQKELLGKTKEERHTIVAQWREEYAETNGEEIIRQSLNIEKNPLKELRARYKEVTGKNVAPKYINDAEYMEKAIKEALHDEAPEEQPEITETTETTETTDVTDESK